ncbi:MAG TPA: GTP-binding protein [Symbiobacteriaceae bacterium]
MGLHAEFVISAMSPHQFPEDGLPEIALVGRSNVGKSSLINCLVRMNKLAKTSNTPGRTQSLNFYRIWPEGKPRFGDSRRPQGSDAALLRGSAAEAARAAGAFYFVDMPGYGYAKVSESQRRAWRKLIEQYLLERRELCAVIQIVDLRHPPTQDDITMWEWLRYYGKVRLCVATKADKVSRGQRPVHAREIAAGLGLRDGGEPGPGPFTPEQEPLLLFSAEDGLGRDKLWYWVLGVTRQARGR